MVVNEQERLLHQQFRSMLDSVMGPDNAELVATFSQVGISMVDVAGIFSTYAMFETLFR